MSTRGAEAVGAEALHEAFYDMLTKIVYLQASHDRLRELLEIRRALGSNEKPVNGDIDTFRDLVHDYSLEGGWNLKYRLNDYSTEQVERLARASYDLLRDPLQRVITKHGDGIATRTPD